MFDAPIIEHVSVSVKDTRLVAYYGPKRAHNNKSHSFPRTSSSGTSILHSFILYQISTNTNSRRVSSVDFLVLVKCT